MYYKITSYGDPNYTKLGMINVDAALYLEEGDEGYNKYIEEHYVTIPVFPKEGYKGKMTTEGMPVPVDMEDYKKWLESLPTIKQLNPFCNHSIQFEADVTEEEILAAFDRALHITHQNYLIDDLHCKNGGTIVNEDIKYRERVQLYENPTSDLQAKVASAESKIESLKTVDFKQITGDFKVK